MIGGDINLIDVCVFVLIRIYLNVLSVRPFIEC